VFGRNLYEIDDTNSILTIRLALYCPIFEEIKSTFSSLLIFKSLCSGASHLDVSPILYFFPVQIQNKHITVLTARALKWAWNDAHAFVALNDDAEHSDQIGEENLESASIQCSRR
jgi:hypothetical protein